MMLSRTDPLTHTCHGYKVRGIQQYQHGENPTDKLENQFCEKVNTNMADNISNKRLNQVKHSTSSVTDQNSRYYKASRKEVIPNNNEKLNTNTGDDLFVYSSSPVTVKNYQYHQALAQHNSDMVPDRSTPREKEVSSNYNKKRNASTRDNLSNKPLYRVRRSTSLGRSSSPVTDQNYQYYQASTQSCCYMVPNGSTPREKEVISSNNEKLNANKVDNYNLSNKQLNQIKSSTIFVHSSSPVTVQNYQYHHTWAQRSSDMVPGRSTPREKEVSSNNNEKLNASTEDNILNERNKSNQNRHNLVSSHNSYSIAPVKITPGFEREKNITESNHVVKPDLEATGKVFQGSVIMKNPEMSAEVILNSNEELNANTDDNILNKQLNQVKITSTSSIHFPSPISNSNSSAQKTYNLFPERSTPRFGIDRIITESKPDPEADASSHERSFINPKVVIYNSKEKLKAVTKDVIRNIQLNQFESSTLSVHSASQLTNLNYPNLKASGPFIKTDPEVIGSVDQSNMTEKHPLKSEISSENAQKTLDSNMSSFTSPEEVLPTIIEQDEPNLDSFRKPAIDDYQSHGEFSMKSLSISLRSFESMRSLPSKFKKTFQKVIHFIKPAKSSGGDKAMAENMSADTSSSFQSMKSLHQQIIDKMDNVTDRMDNVTDKMDNVTDVVNTAVNENSKNLHVAINKPGHLNAKEFADCYYFVNLFSYVATLVNNKTYKTFVAKMLHCYSDSFIEQEIKQLKENSKERRKDSKIDKYEKRVSDFLLKWMRSYAYPEDIEHTLKDALIAVNKNFEGVNLFEVTPQYYNTSAVWLEEKNLHNLSKMFTEEYQSIGFDLGFTRARLQQFQANNPNDVVGRNSDMLIGWKNKQNPSVSEHMMKGELIKAFARAERNDLVKIVDS